MKKTILFLLFSCFLASCGGKHKQHSECKNCSDFSTQSEAKSYAKAYKKCKNALDHNNDGR